MRRNIVVGVSADRARLEAIVIDRNGLQKHVWRARIVQLKTGVRSSVGTDSWIATY